jgi:hypothetical protein
MRLHPLALLLSFCALASAPLASAAAATPLHQRLSQGYRLETIAPGPFERVFNEGFLPLFPKAHPEGLLAYRPALPKPVKPCHLPAEIALLTFESEARYAQYKETEIGRAIRDAHPPVFDAKTSKSLVPEVFEGQVQLEHAYDLQPKFDAYGRAHSALIVHCGKEAVDPAALARVYAAPVKRAGKTPQPRDVIFAASGDHLIEYVFYDLPSDIPEIFKQRRALFSPFYAESRLIPLKKTRIGAAPVRAGHGIDAQW